MIPVASPQLMPWVRDVNKRLETLERKIPATASASRFTFLTEEPLPIVAPAGIGNWGVLSDALSIAANTTTGLLKITVAACCKASWTNTAADIAAVGAMIFTVDGVLDYDMLDTYSERGLMNSFTATGGKPAALSQSGSVTRIIKVAPGGYNVRVAYLYKNLTGNVNLMWSNRALIVEQV